MKIGIYSKINGGIEILHLQARFPAPSTHTNITTDRSDIKLLTIKM